MHVTGTPASPTVLRVGDPTWPYREFGAYLRQLMAEARPAPIANSAELSRLTGINESLFSRWRSGQVQPGTESLRKVATVLGIAPVRLFIAAGLTDEQELNLTASPDLTVLPAELRELIELWPELSDDQQKYARRFLATLMAGLRAELGKSKNSPPSRRRPA